jgi:two-component system cell cycle sensor histidine kinase/response regulator CckA
MPKPEAELPSVRDRWVAPAIPLTVGLLGAAVASSAFFGPDRAWALAVGLIAVVLALGTMFRQLAARAGAEARDRHFVDLLGAILNGTSDAIYAKDRSGRYEFLNPAGAAALGVAGQDIIGKDDTALLDPASAAAEMERDQVVLASGITTTLDEVATARATGETRVWTTTKGVVRDARGAVVGIFGISRDITGRLELERRLQDGERLEAIGRLAGGVAHDFNNILGAIIGNAELMRDELAATDRHRADLQEILAASFRARDLTRQLLAFSRRQVLEQRVLDLNALIRGVDSMIGRLIGEDIGVELGLAPDLGQVRADPGQISQVLMNLAVNARDAMPGGGVLKIETHNVDLDEDYARSHAPVVPGRYICLMVTDTGTGMDEQTRLHLFEPFFTTKDVHKGTGLGLATVYGIVKQSGGFIWVYSEPGMGATFKVYLPRVDEPVTVDALPLLRSTDEHRGSATILVVEDDAAVLRVASSILERNAYRVLTANGPKEALALLDGLQQPVHLLLSDIVMPGMSGPELAEVVMARLPGIRVLLQSGYSELAIGRRGNLGQVAFIQKPYSADTLLRTVRETLEALPSVPVSPKGSS